MSGLDVEPAPTGGAADDAVIVTETLSKRYGSLVAVDELDLRIRPGEIYGLLGPNGAGKTTTILMLLGLTAATSGSAQVLGLDPARDALAVKRRVGYLPDSVGFYEGLTGRENLGFVAELNGVGGQTADTRISQLLEQVRLTEAADDAAGTYSRGMRQRLGIADALVKDPDILILDEPTIAIDPEGVDQILGVIRRLCDEQDVTVLLSSHLLYQVQSICDRVGIFVGGELVAEGAIEQLAEQIGGTQEIEVAPADPASAEVLASVEGVAGVRTEGERHVVSARGDVREALVRELAAAGRPVRHLRRRGDELEEIYRRYFRREEPDDDPGS